MKVFSILIILSVISIVIAGISISVKASDVQVIDSCIYQGHEYFIFSNNGVAHNPECKGCYNKFE